MATYQELIAEYAKQARRSKNVSEERRIKRDIVNKAEESRRNLTSKQLADIRRLKYNKSQDKIFISRSGFPSGKFSEKTDTQIAVEKARRTGQEQIVRQGGQVYTVRPDGSFEARGQTLGERDLKTVGEVAKATEGKGIPFTRQVVSAAQSEVVEKVGMQYRYRGLQQPKQRVTPTQTKQKEKSDGFEEAVMAQREREQRFYQSEGVQRLKRTGGLLSTVAIKIGNEAIKTNFPILRLYNKEIIPSQSGFIYETGKIVATGYTGAPIFLGSTAVMAGEKLYLVGRGLVASPENTIKETFIDAPKRTVVQTYDPRTPKGAATYVSAAVGAFFLTPRLIKAKQSAAAAKSFNRMGKTEKVNFKLPPRKYADTKTQIQKLPGKIPKRVSPESQTVLKIKVDSRTGAEIEPLLQRSQYKPSYSSTTRLQLATKDAAQTRLGYKPYISDFGKKLSISRAKGGFVTEQNTQVTLNIYPQKTYTPTPIKYYSFKKFDFFPGKKAQFGTLQTIQKTQGIPKTPYQPIVRTANIVKSTYTPTVQTPFTAFAITSITGVAAVKNIQTRQEVDIQPIQKNKQLPKTKFLPIVGYQQITRVASSFKVEQQTKQKQKQDLEVAFEKPTQNVTRYKPQEKQYQQIKKKQPPTPKTPKPKFEFDFKGFKTQKAPKTKKKKIFSSIFGRTPSGFAAAFGIKGKRTKIGEKTGLGLRPIIRA